MEFGTRVKEDDGMDKIYSEQRIDVFKVFDMQRFMFDSTKRQVSQKMGDINRKITENSFSQLLAEQMSTK